jgi:CBS domain-containing protein
MNERVSDIYVEEVMTKFPIIAKPDMTVHQAAKTMKAERVGSLVIVEDDTPIGIITERDLVDKVVAEGKVPSKVTVKEVMSTPLVTVGPNESVAEAARRMSTLKMRRLPVVFEGHLIGILTENDILRISPSLIEITREWAKIKGPGSTAGIGSRIASGYCENCRAFSSELRSKEGQMLCADCYDQWG